MRSVPEPRVPVAVLREAVRRAVELRSTRKVATALGISPAGVRYFLAGGRPYPQTLRKLTAWYAREIGGLLQVSPEMAEAALSTFLESVPHPVRDTARRKIVEAMRSAFAECRWQVPAWLQTLDVHASSGRDRAVVPEAEEK